MHRLMVCHYRPALDLVDHLLVQPLQDVDRSLELELNIASLYLLFQLADRYNEK